MPDSAAPSGEPQSFVRGDTVEWIRSFSDHLPEDGWTLTYHLVSAEQKKTIVTTDNLDSTHKAEILANDSLDYLPGDDWSWQAVLTKGADVFTLDSGTMVVEEGFGGLTAGHDDRSFWSKVLQKSEQAVLNAAGNSELSVSVDGFSATFESLDDLIRFRARAAGHVEAEKNRELMRRGHPAKGNRLGVRF